MIKILLVENNPADAHLTREMLAEQSADRFDLVHVDRLSEALRRLRRESFHLILLDLSLSDAYGLDTLRQVQAKSPGLPILVLSGLNDEALALQAVQNGAQDYLVKGQANGDLLARAIRYAIERKRAEERLTYLAQYDHLTGLANRALLRDRLVQALARSKRKGHPIGLMFLDLDRFKTINDTLGHDFGDQLLKGVADRLRSCVRQVDTVGRMGGDEFSILLETIASEKGLTTLAQRILDAIAQPFVLEGHQAFVLEGHQAFVTVSIGITVYPADDEDANNLLKHADTAMYRAKQQGGNTYQFFTPEMQSAVRERLAIEEELRKGLAQDEFVLYYQPFFDLATRTITGVEAIVRWRTPASGLTMPSHFIPIAEETGLMIPLGAWVLRTACAQAKAWQEAGFPSLRIAVNVSGRQFRQRNVASSLSQILYDTRLDPHSLILELPESVFMLSADATATTLEELKRLGVRLAIDDFGAGFSSLSHLKSFPLDILKIDQSFVRDLTSNPNAAAIAAAIIAMAKSLKLTVIAEGVETDMQAAFLAAQG
ncbi:MAG TPA: EAL domain-containing protein, partial [Nitrospiraceae bacterium]|nr:EAL domain-containing protein [Nitrospiraceae bacterium]